MAKADYALCAHCDGKAFYDAETDTRDTVTFHPDCLAAHDRAVKTEALREAAEDFTSPIDPTCYLTTEGRKFIRARAAVELSNALDGQIGFTP